MKLFYAPASPFARKVRTVIIELELEHLVELILTPVVPGKPNEAYTSQHNPLGKIPALSTDDAGAIYDSTIICEYLNSIARNTSIIPAEGTQRWRVMTSHCLAHGICESAVTVRYETFLRPEQQQWQVWIDDQWGKIDRALTWFSDNEDLWQGNIDLAQLTLGCALGYLDFRSPEHNWRADHPALAQWFETISKRPSFTATLPT